MKTQLKMSYWYYSSISGMPRMEFILCQSLSPEQEIK